MVVRVEELTAYEDERGNRIDYAGPPVASVTIKFTGSHNVLTIAPTAKLNSLKIDFDCDHGRVELGGSKGPRFAAAIRVGDRSSVVIGDNVSATTPVAMSAAEATTIRIGNDVMMASDVQIRADDGHPIFDVATGRRVNVSRSITVGHHVWLGLRSAVLGGVTIGDGSVVGMGSIVTKSLPNNVVADRCPREGGAPRHRLGTTAPDPESAVPQARREHGDHIRLLAPDDERRAARGPRPAAVAAGGRPGQAGRALSGPAIPPVGVASAYEVSGRLPVVPHA